MPIDWMWGLFGGALIGSAAAAFLLLNGRVMGASGVIGTIVDRSAGGRMGENLALLAGLFVAPGVLAWVMGGAQTYATSQIGVLIAGGVLVGLGTRLANGCTSGHGVCGISRLSVRGIAATACYIGAGGAAVVIFKHLLGIL